MFFNVTGVPDPITMENVEDDAFDISMTFDTLSMDPETMQSRLTAIISLLQFDTTGRIDRDKLIEFAAMVIDQGLAGYVLKPQQDATQDVVRAVTDDLAKIWAGIEVGAQPTGAQVALQIIQAWTQQPDVAQALGQNEALMARATKYAEQYQFQMTQAQNAQIGRLGTAPADFQGTNNQP